MTPIDSSGRRCHTCDYDLRGTIAAEQERCPECGMSLNTPGRSDLMDWIVCTWTMCLITVLIFLVIAMTFFEVDPELEPPATPPVLKPNAGG